MLGRLENRWRRLRTRFSLSEWLARWLKVPATEPAQTANGLLMLQIDGLSYRELEKAMERGEMPFLTHLLKSEHYRLYEQYAGVPSTTPAYQAALLYGVEQAVPGFNFYHRGMGRLVRMFEPGSALEVEAWLNRQLGQDKSDPHNRPLLDGGSSYSDNFTGGANEPHFCPSAAGWGPSLRETRLFVRAFFIIANVFSLVRALILMVAELFLAFWDFARGVTAGKDLMGELKFIPTRALIVILLRELVALGVRIDLARGLKIIHANLLGYDEQSHRRGPGSQFAHWTLKGIDWTIARLWHAAQRAGSRHYDIWIYSDHGQESVTPYTKLHNRYFSDAVVEVISRFHEGELGFHTSGQQSVQLHRARYMGGSLFGRELFHIRDGSHDNSPRTPDLSIASLGPLANLYYKPGLGEEKAEKIARALVTDAGVPIVLRQIVPVEGETQVRRATVWTIEGRYELPRDAVQVLGKDHPFAEEAAFDLARLTHHVHSGEFLCCGWRKSQETLTFAEENGAHGGPGSRETRAFALLPADIPLLPANRTYTRPVELRRAAIDFLHKTPGEQMQQEERAAGTIRIMTYNVHSCIGMDGKISPWRIARIIARYEPDVVALQELDIGRSRTDLLDQAHIIARYLQMEYRFHPSFRVREGKYGNAVLSQHPMELVKAEKLPGLGGKPDMEPRAAIWVKVDFKGRPIHLINTHLGLRQAERLRQVEALLGEKWLGNRPVDGPCILCGDLNLSPFSPVYRLLSRGLKDVQKSLRGHLPRATFSSRFPSARLDHVFVDGAMSVSKIITPNTELVRQASDHLPLVVDLEL
ncbi:MAG: endonuclease/exonuclease/phosphatase family protein [Pseudohongiellaceae bacterium]